MRVNFFRAQKTLFASLGFLLIFSVTVSYAVPPASSYNPGETLDPSCAPGSNNCTVAISPWTRTGSNVYYNTGSVGIGISSPQEMLDMLGNSAVIKQTTSSSAAGSDGSLHRLQRSRGTPLEPLAVAAGDVIGAIGFRGYDGANYLSRASIVGTVNGTVSTGVLPIDLIFRVGATSPIKDAMRIAANGRTMISSTGTTSAPSSTLHVSGNDTATGGITIATNGTNRLAIWGNGSASTTFQALAPSSTINFSDSLGTAIMTLSADGTDNYVGVHNVSPSYLLHIGSSTTPSGIVAEFQTSTANCTLNPTNVGGLSCSSDMTLKKNIVNLSDGSSWSFKNNVSFPNQTALEKILALNPVQYNWNTENDGLARHTGFIAQEVRQVLPELIFEDSDNHLLALNYTGLIPYTIKAIQEINLNITAISNLERTNPWRTSLTVWLGSTVNGIKKVASDELSAKDKICINETCVTEIQLQQLLSSQNSMPASQAPSTDSNQNDIPTTLMPAEQSPAVAPPEITPPADDTLYN